MTNRRIKPGGGHVGEKLGDENRSNDPVTLLNVAAAGVLVLFIVLTIGACFGLVIGL